MILLFSVVRLQPFVIQSVARSGKVGATGIAVTEGNRAIDVLADFAHSLSGIDAAWELKGLGGSRR